MFKKVLIVGCGLIGSSILRAIHSKKLSKKIFVLEKSKKNVFKIKKIKSNCKFIKSINDFYNQDELLSLIKSTGFENTEYRDLSGGIAAIHSGWKI